jgi:hypothetical protein
MVEVAGFGQGQDGNYDDTDSPGGPMRNDTRWRVIPSTRFTCVVSLIAGVLLLGSAIWTLNTQPVRIPVLQIIAGVAAAALIVCAVIGLASPRLRGR